MNGKILAIAGSDPSGGAGIQADIKTISALGGYAMAAITALTVQNTQKVYDVHPVAADIVAAQVVAVLDDIRPDAVKMGMIGTSETLVSLVSIFSDNRDIPLIVDPVLLSTSGRRLMEERGVEVLISDLFPLIHLLTPNLDEAALLTGVETVNSIPDMIRAGEALLKRGPQAVLVKGGHLSGEILTDLLVTPDGVTEFTSPMIATRHTHGTGCTLASAIATGVAQGMSLRQAVDRAHAYVHKAIVQAPGFGQGKGPLNHLVPLD